MGKVIGIEAGSSGLFTASLIPFYAQPLQSGPTFSTKDSKVKLSKLSDPFRVIATVADDNTATSFSLTISGHNKKNGKISNTFVIPIL